MPKLLLALFASFILLSCDREPEYDPAHDYFSFANTDAFVTDHLQLDLDVDFIAMVLRGTAVLHMRNLHPGERTIVLDSRDLVFASAAIGREGEGFAEVQVRLAEDDHILGQALELDLPLGFDPQGGFELKIQYQTSPDASALQWLPPDLTAGGEHPLMFSQSQAVHARSWVPLQDTPAMRITYEATIRTPPGLLAVMSADNDPDTPRDGEYHFEMPQPIPPYLLAIAAGDFYFAPIGEDTGVYAEPQILEAAAWEFGETQDMLDLAETMFGPYQWGRYDLLILPASFPYGGMENPRLSFITPSVIAGDRSLVSLIAHELAHSWSGNLVTNATLRDGWINEGTTSYLEARLMEELFGRERTDEERVLSFEALLAGLQVVSPAMQPLAPKLMPSDGEDGQQGLQYAKGQFFLEHLERQFGRETFDAFLAGYFKAFEWKSITTEQFLDYLDAHLLQPNPGVYSRKQAEEWLYQPGLPADFIPPESSNLDMAASAARAWAAGEIDADALDHEGWSPQAMVHFINSLPPDLGAAQLGELDAALGLSESRNAEIGRAWFIQVAKRRFEAAYPAMREHLLRHGRMRLVTPVYKALVLNNVDAGLAMDIFEQARASYHPITIEDVSNALAPVTESH